MTAPRSSTSTRSSGYSAEPQPRKHQVSSMCVEKGKWYDCLRPTATPYQGFGGMKNFAVNNAQGAGVGENWTEDVYAKMNIK